MKKFFSILFAAILIPCLIASATSFENMQKFSKKELGGIITGVCYASDGSYCVYGDSAYVIIDGEESSYFTIEHPNIRKNMPHIRGVFERDGKYVAIVYDSYARMSYYVSDLGSDNEKYGKLRENVFEKGAMSPEGLLVTGQKNGLLWIGLLAQDGSIRWEQLGFASGFFFQTCAYYNGNYYTVSRHHRLPLMLVSIFNDKGKRIYNEQYDLKEMLGMNKKSLLDVNAMNVDKDGIFIAGRVLPMKEVPYGITMQFDIEGKNPQINKYDKVSNILASYPDDNGYSLLAEDRARNQYYIVNNIISETGKNALRIDNIIKNSDKISAYGIVLGGIVESFVADMK